MHTYNLPEIRQMWNDKTKRLCVISFSNVVYLVTNDDCKQFGQAAYKHLKVLYILSNTVGSKMATAALRTNTCTLEESALYTYLKICTVEPQ